MSTGERLPRAPSTGLRKLLPELLLASATVLVFAFGLAGLELLARRADPHYLDRVLGLTVYSERYGWEPRPGFEGLLHGVFTTVNARGYRGREHSYEKQGRTRILMLGDSIAFGARVTDGQTFSALLESRSERFDVVNLAVEGYGTDQELLRLEHEGLRYHPDVVILNFCMTNDVLNNVLRTDTEDERVRKPYFTWEGEGLRLHDEQLRLSWLRRIAQWLTDKSHLYHRAIGLLPAWTEQRPTTEDGAKAEDRIGQRATELTFRLIQRIDEVARSSGARLLVLLHPDEPAYRRRSRLLQEFCWTSLLKGIPVVDLGERYRAEGMTFDQIAADYQGHLTPLGHHFAAEEIEALLAEAPPREHRVACRDAPP